MTRSRMTGAERRLLILESARRVFSKHGYEAARTQEIARGSGVSEALLYRHFPSKQALYRAVLRQTIREQNASYDVLGIEELNGRGLVRNLRAYFGFAVSDAPDPIKEGFRLLVASVAGDGSFASLVYRRANRMMAHRVSAALEAARADGDVVGVALSQRNTSMFIEHVGTMLNTIAMNPARLPYEGDADRVAREAVWFCCRGLGFTDEAIARHCTD